MDQRLVIDPLVGLRALRVSVEYQHFAERVRPNDRDVLESGSPAEIRLGDRVMVLLRRRKLFDVPLPVFGFRHPGRVKARLAAGPFFQTLRPEGRSDGYAVRFASSRLSASAVTTCVYCPLPASMPRFTSVVRMLLAPNLAAAYSHAFQGSV
jgi:hypothetical protein